MLPQTVTDPSECSAANALVDVKTLTTPSHLAFGSETLLGAFEPPAFAWPQTLTAPFACRAANAPSDKVDVTTLSLTESPVAVTLTTLALSAQRARCESWRAARNESRRYSEKGGVGQAVVCRDAPAASHAQRSTCTTTGSVSPNRHGAIGVHRRECEVVRRDADDGVETARTEWGSVAARSNAPQGMGLRG